MPIRASKLADLKPRRNYFHRLSVVWALDNQCGIGATVMRFTSEKQGAAGAAFRVSNVSALDLGATPGVALMAAASPLGKACLSFAANGPYNRTAERPLRMQTGDIAALINRVAMGDRAAFSLFYKETSPRVFAICLRILRDRSEAEEALQEIYIKVWQRAKTFATGAGAPLTWLSVIARNHAIDIIRGRKPIADDLDETYDIADDTIATPERQTMMAEEGRRIDRCLGELDPTHARAVRSAYVDGLSYAELAEDLQVPLNTVRTWLRRSLLKLRECMQR